MQFLIPSFLIAIILALGFCRIRNKETLLEVKALDDKNELVRMISMCESFEDINSAENQLRVFQERYAKRFDIDETVLYLQHLIDDRTHEVAGKLLRAV